MRHSQLTPRYKAACISLADAIQEHRDAFLEMADLVHPEENHSGENEVLTDWAVIAAYIGYDDEGDQTTAYHVVLPDDQMPDHRLRGLWHQGIAMLEEHRRD